MTMMGPGSVATESSVLALLEVVANPEKHKALILDLVAKNDALTVRENKVSLREVAVGNRETSVAQAESELSQKIAETEDAINARATLLVQRETKLANDLGKLADEQQATRQESAQNRSRAAVLDERERDVTVREAANRTLMKALDADRAEIDRKKAVLAQL